MLKVDLTTRSIVKEEIPEQYMREYIGGLGLGARLYYELVPPNAEPLSPDNVVFLMTGPVQGTLIPGAGRGLFISKS
ncbi:MAG: aldehyde ferredoxin oxidoreductase N-terminal domain-containing protein, partial [Sulfolobales archaeon]